MSKFQYSEWDGTQDIFNLDADDLMQELEQNLMSSGDLSRSLRMMQRGGLRDSQGRKLPSIQELLQRLNQRRQNQLDKYNLGSVMKDIKEKLDNIIKTEREGIQRRLDEARQKASQGKDDLDPEMQQKLLKAVEDMAAEHLKKLDELPPDVGGRVKELTQYNFMDADASRQFQELMDMLKKSAMSSFTQDLMQRVQSMDANSIAAMRQMLRALNEMLEQRARGEEPNFQEFMRQFGDFFGPNPPKNLDELIEHLQRQIAQAQSLLDSMSPEDRRQLEELLDSMLDEDTKYEMSKLASRLDAIFPLDELLQQYSFSGDEPLSYQEALKLMEELQQMDKLENQFHESQYRRTLDNIDDKLVREVIGDDAAKELEQLRQITKVLEDAGYIQMKDGRWELTPRGMRKIGQKALQSIFAHLNKDRIGGHLLNIKGGYGERIEETKKYDYGDDLELHIQRSIMNAVMREPNKPPVRMTVDDFEVYRSESITRSATVLLIDLSLSMPMRGNFEAAKRVAIALDNLIRSQYPKDSLYIVGFSSYAREIKKEDLTVMNWDEFDPYTNLQHGLFVARKLLNREICNNKQIILITDGEPTAHIEGGRLYFRMPPTTRTLQLTLNEARKCTQKSITINTFMLSRGRYLDAFITYMARLNKGRVFFSSADNLGQYLLVDYISHKTQKIRA